MSVLFYTLQNIGLGHISRQLGIAGALRERDSSLPVLFLTELADTQLLRLSIFPYYSLPDIHSPDIGKRWSTMTSSPGSVWSALVRSILQAHRPGLIIHDTGIIPDFFSLVEGLGCRQVLILRHRTDLLSYLAHNHPRVAAMDLIAFPHEPDEIPKFHLPWLDESRLMFCGPLLRRSRRDIDLAAVRTAYGITPDLLTVVVTNGGGNAAPDGSDDHFPETVFSALQALGPGLPPYRVIFISGPLSSALPALPDLRSGQVLIRDFDPNLIDLFAAADLVIARGGYNSVLELEQIGVPAICVPAWRGLDDQDGRIRQAESRSKNIRYVPLDVNALQPVIRDILTGPRWFYQPSLEPDPIARNKLALADRLLALL